MKHFYTNPVFLLLVLSSIFCKSSVAQNFHLVKDINASTDANPSNYNIGITKFNSKKFAVLNGITFFAANDGVHGKGLWRSDGTEAGTWQVKEGVDPYNITASNGKVFFAGSGNIGLWASDGTENGTIPVLKQLPRDVSSFYPSALTDFNGSVFFVISGYAYNSQLWKSDGTESGTILVKNFASNEVLQSLDNLSNLIAIKNKIYFTAICYTPTYRTVLCVSDGSSSGTHIISKEMTDPAQMIAGSPNVKDSLVYFTASNPNDGYRSLYVTNGDSANAAKANNFNGFTSFDYLQNELVNINGVIYFVGRSDYFVRSNSLYKLDIHLAQGIEPVKIVTGSNPGGQWSYVSNLTNINNTLYFTVFDAVNNKSELWKSNGRSDGNVQLHNDIIAGAFTEVNDVVYFSGTAKSSGIEIWRTDGSANGTSIVKDIFVGFNNSSPTFLTRVNDKLFFSAADKTHGNELWKSDGTASGTSLVKDINQNSTSASTPLSFSRYKDTVVFLARPVSGANQARFWKSNGTSSRTTVIVDSINILDVPNRGNSIIRSSLYFFGSSSTIKQGFYKSDINSGETFLIKDFTYTSIDPYAIISTDSLVYFSLYNFTSSKYELWRSDGMEGNTYMIKNDFNYLNGNSLYVSTGRLLFFVPPYTNTLWKTDGTVGGTKAIRYFQDEPSGLAAFNGMLLFDANDNVGSGIWKSDGTTGGTIKISDSPINASNFTPVDASLFFTAFSYSGKYGYIGTELFKMDSLASKIELVKDIHPGSDGTTIYKSINQNGLLFFFTNPTYTTQLELWKSDGTVDGTQFITAVGTDGANYPPSLLVGCNGKMFFIIRDVLWESDGTANGTRKVEDNILPTLIINQYSPQLTAVGNQLFFTASNYKYGEELYAGTISKPGITYYISVANGNWNAPATWAGNVVPPEGASVIVRHNVIGNINTSCKELRIEEPGNLTMIAGFNIKILE